MSITGRPKVLRVVKSMGSLSKLAGAFRSKERSSPISQLLLSNVPPSDSDAACTRAAILEMEAENIRLKLQLVGNVTESKKAIIIRQIEETNTQIQRHKSILSNIRLVPFEILQQIFLFLDNTPWPLSQVCRSWRNSAISLPALWITLPKVVLKSSTSKTKTQVDMLTELLRRSSNSPLDISVWTSGRAVKNRSARLFHMHPVIQLLVAHSSRWRVASLKLPEVVVASLQEIKGNLPLLTNLSLTILCSSHTDTNNGITIIDTFEVAPQLKYVDLEGMYSAEFKLPLANLVRYFHDIRSPIRLNQFADCSHLEEFTLSYRGTILPTTTPSTIPLSHLTKLRLECYFSSHRSFLIAIDLPVVEEIYLSSGSENVFSDLRAMFLRSALPFSLKKLHMRTGAPPAHNDLTDLLRIIPGLIHLDTTVPCHTDISALGAIDNPSTLLVPNLQTCTFHLDGHASNEIRRAIRRMATSRCEPRGNPLSPSLAEFQPLKTFELQSNGGVRPEWLRDAEIWTPILQQAFFEDWTPTAAFGTLWSLKMKLYAELPNLHLWRVTRPKLSDFNWPKRVHAILTEIEDHETLDPRDLLLCNFHILMQSLNKEYLSSDVNYSFFDHAERILTKWKPLIKKCLDDIHWGFTSRSHSCLVYIRDDHPMRGSNTMLDAIIYGAGAKSGILEHKHSISI